MKDGAEVSDESPQGGLGGECSPARTEFREGTEDKDGGQEHGNSKRLQRLCDGAEVLLLSSLFVINSRTLHFLKTLTSLEENPSIFGSQPSFNNI